MKSLHLLFTLLMCLGGTIGVHARELKAVSRMSYYTDETQPEILVYLPDGEARATLDGSETRYELRQGVNLLPLALDGLAMGPNLRQLTIEHPDGRREQFGIELLRLEPKRNEVKIDRLTGTLRVHG